MKFDRKSMEIFNLLICAVLGVQIHLIRYTPPIQQD